MGVISLKAQLKKQTLKKSPKKSSNGKGKHGIRDSKAIALRQSLIGARDYKHGSYTIYHVGYEIHILIRPKRYQEIDKQGHRSPKKSDYHNFRVGIRDGSNFKADLMFLTQLLPAIAKFAGSDRQTILNQLEAHCRKYPA